MHSFSLSNVANSSILENPQFGRVIVTNSVIGGLSWLIYIYSWTIDHIRMQWRLMRGSLFSNANTF